MRPTLRRNGTHMVTVRTTSYLTRQDVAAILAMDLTEQEEPLPTSQFALEKVVRSHLAAHGKSRLDWWSDYVTQEQVDEADEHLVRQFGWPD